MAVWFRLRLNTVSGKGAPVEPRRCGLNRTRFDRTRRWVVREDRCQPEPMMSIAHSVAEVLQEHVTLELEGIDRMYLNVYVPGLQHETGVASFFRYHRGAKFASSVLMQPMTDAFVAKIHQFVQRLQVPQIDFEKHQRKDDVMKEHLAKFSGTEGVLFVGRAQEKAPVFRTERRKDPKSGASYPWIVRGTAMVNHFYFYCVDEDFGPFFIKFCTYFPYTAKLCINGHEYLKCQLRKAGIRYEALDNGVLSCSQPERLQRMSDALSPEKIDALLRKWLRRLPHPFTAKDRTAGYRYDISILQAEFSLTQVLDEPVNGRVFFEEVIRENLDIGRPSQVQLIFGRGVLRTTPGRFRTRVITDGVIPSLHADYKRARIKQYFKESLALRTETTINDTRDFKIGRRLKNLPQLRKIGFAANRAMLQVEKVSHDCTLGEKAFQKLQSPVIADKQRAAALRFGDPRVLALLQVLVLFCFLPEGFRNKTLREHFARLLGLDPSAITQGQMTYQLRRLKLHGLIRRVPKTHRYELTAFGLRATMFLSRLYTRAIRSGLSFIDPHALPSDHRLRRAFESLEKQIDIFCEKEKISA